MTLLQLVPQGGINASCSVVGQGCRDPAKAGSLQNKIASLSCLPYIFEDKFMWKIVFTFLIRFL
jgi:hypothetical protein